MSEKGKDKVFDPTVHLMRVQGNKEYLPVAARIAWLAATTPRYTIDTDLIDVSEDRTLARATVTIFNDGGEIVRRATDYKQEDARGFKDHTEKAITGSVGRALAQLGFGTLYATELADELSADRPADAPRQAPSRQPTRNQQQRQAAPPKQEAAGRAPAGVPSNWNEFWTWARANGLPGKQSVEEAAGQSIEGLLPAQLYELIVGKAEAADRTQGPPPATEQGALDIYAPRDTARY